MVEALIHPSRVIVYPEKEPEKPRKPIVKRQHVLGMEVETSDQTLKVTRGDHTERTQLSHTDPCAMLSIFEGLERIGAINMLPKNLVHIADQLDATLWRDTPSAFSGIADGITADLKKNHDVPVERSRPLIQGFFIAQQHK